MSEPEQSIITWRARFDNSAMFDLRRHPVRGADGHDVLVITISGVDVNTWWERNDSTAAQAFRPRHIESIEVVCHIRANLETE